MLPIPLYPLKIAVLASIVLLIMAGCSSREKSFDFIDDQMGFLSKQERQRIADYHEALLKKLDIHIKAVVLKESPAVTPPMEEEKEIMNFIK